MLRSMNTLWKFSRPHTIIGSVISIITLYFMAKKGTDYSDLLLLSGTIVAALGCNIFIVGLNQIIDLESDKVNKPYLPVASGELTLNRAKQIIGICLIVSVSVSFLISIVLAALIISIILIGIIYSVPPIQLKRHHLPAAVAITLVRGILVNIGMFFHFRYSLTGTFGEAIPALWILTSFVVAFSIAIAWFKDMPDVVGDLKFKIKTLAVLYSEKVVFWSGFSLVFFTYLITIIWCYHLAELFLFYCHIFALILFLANAWGVDLTIKASITKFYMRFWLFFFAEYLFFGVWSLI